MTREQAKAEIEGLVAEQAAVWGNNFRKYMDLRACDAGLCGKIDSLVERANTCKDPKDRADLEAQVNHLRDCRKEKWNRVDRELLHAEIEIRRRLRRTTLTPADVGIPSLNDEEY